MTTRRGKRKADQAGKQDIWREKLQFLSDAMESTSQPFGAGSPEGSTMIFNEAFCRLTGYSREELYHINWATDLTTPESRAGELAALAVLDRTHEPQRYEKCYRRKDGTIIPIELLAHVAMDSQGSILYYYSFITDISDRKRKEETVRAARDDLEARVAERTAELEAANENLQIKGEEMEMQAEEIQSQNEELRNYNDELEKLTLALQEREMGLSQLAAIVTSSDNAIIGKTLDGTIMSWNAAAERIYGYSAAEAIGRHTDIIVPPGLSGELRVILQKIKTGQRVENHETQRVARDGRLIDTSITISPIIDRDGKVIGASTIARDITAAKAAENALKKSQFILAKSQEMALVGNWAWNVQTGEMNGSDENYRLYGYQPGEVTSTEDWVRTRVHPADMAAVDAFIAAVRHDGVRKSIDYRVRRKDGAIRYLTTVADKIVRDKAGQVKWIYGITQDITERKLAEEASRENEHRLERSQGIAHLGSWELDLQTNRLSWSDEVYRIFGLQPQEFGATYEAFLEAVHPEDRAAVDAAYSGSVRDGKDTYEIEHRIVRKPKGEVRVVQEKCEHFRDDSGRIVRSVGMVHDITERKRLEDALKEREKQLSARLNAILSPGCLDDKTIAEIVDIPSLQEMADSFHELSGVANAIIDLNGVVLVGSGWQDICTKFHRCHPETLKNCIESDRHLSGSVEEGKYAVYKCKNGMWDVVTPIVVSGRHIANLFVGQFFFDDEVPDYDYFRRQSGIYNFDRDEYLAALEKVPRHSREKIRDVMGFYTRFAAMVSQLSYSNVQLAQSLIIQKESEHALQEKMEEIEVQAEEIEVQNDELRANVDELGERTRSLRESEERERARAEELQEAKAQAELYLDLMGHDISNMHQIALSQLELAQEIMQDEGQIADEEIELIATPIETLQRSARLIENVGKLQKLRAGEYRLEPVDLGKVLAEVVEEHSVPGNGAAIRLSGAAGCRVKANPLIKEAFTNLVGNAVKHTHGSPEISVAVSRVAENGSSFYRIAIEDNGPGIPDEKKGEIFHRFRRGQTKAKGTGLGLYIVKTLVENFKGRVLVEDRVPGDYTKGSKFIVYLPVAEDLYE
jgi:PAS domain S-box-containing protein